MADHDARDDLHVTGPGGIGLRASGRDLIALVVLIAGLGANVWVLREGFKALEASNVHVHNELRLGFQQIRDDHALQLREDRLFVCILSITPEDRGTAFRSGDPCAWVLSGPVMRPDMPDLERRRSIPPRERLDR